MLYPYGGFHKWKYPKWMAYDGKPYGNGWYDLGVPLFLETTRFAPWCWNMYQHVAPSKSPSFVMLCSYIMVNIQYISFFLWSIAIDPANSGAFSRWFFVEVNRDGNLSPSKAGTLNGFTDLISLAGAEFSGFDDEKCAFWKNHVLPSGNDSHSYGTSQLLIPSWENSLFLWPCSRVQWLFWLTRG